MHSQGLDPGTDEGVLHNRCITVDEAIETIGVQFSAFFVCQALRLLFPVEDLQYTLQFLTLYKILFLVDQLPRFLVIIN